MGENQSGHAFVVPAFKAFVPRKIQPWIYLLMACTFQLSSGMYMGGLGSMVGERSLLREDLTMCLYCNLAGMALYFPLLFRMKFRFTNKTLLTAACIGVIACNLAAAHVQFLPLLWLICFVEGCCKIQGTFECMSTIQLWMTPQRDFTVFFPFLHIIVLNAVQLNDYFATFFAEYLHWTSSHWLIIGLMLCDLLLLTIATRHVRIVRKMPLYGIDWLGALMWAAFFLQLTYLFNYGDHYNWFDGRSIRLLSVTACGTLAACVWRMCVIRHPYISREMWRFHPRYFHVLVLTAIIEVLLGSEFVLEEIFYESGMHYAESVSARFDWIAMVGITCGCLFSWLWMHKWRQSYFRLITIGVAFIGFYLLSYYLVISTDINIEKIYIPVFCRGVAAAITGITLMTALHDMMNFMLFFQALSIFQTIHLFLGGVVGSALYSTSVRYFVNDNIVRYGTLIDEAAAALSPTDFDAFLARFMEQMQVIAVKQVYGWLVIGTLVFFLILLFHDMPARRELKPFPTWKTVGKRLWLQVRLHGGVRA